MATQTSPSLKLPKRTVPPTHTNPLQGQYSSEEWWPPAYLSLGPAHLNVKVGVKMCLSLWCGHLKCHS